MPLYRAETHILFAQFCYRYFSRQFEPRWSCLESFDSSPIAAWIRTRRIVQGRGRGLSTRTREVNKETSISWCPRNNSLFAVHLWLELLFSRVSDAVIDPTKSVCLLQIGEYYFSITIWYNISVNLNLVLRIEFNKLKHGEVWVDTIGWIGVLDRDVIGMGWNFILFFLYNHTQKT